MSLLEHPTAQALLADAEVSPADVVGCRRRLETFLQRYLPRSRVEHCSCAHCLLMPGAMQRLRYTQATESACAAIGLGYIQRSSQRNTAWTHGLWHPHHSRVRVLTHIKKLDDCLGQFLVRVSCACSASHYVRYRTD